MARAIECLAPLGYAYQGNLGIEGREALRSPPGYLAGLPPMDSGKYIAAKTDFLLGVLREAGLPQDVMTAISTANPVQS